MDLGQNPQPESPIPPPVSELQTPPPTNHSFFSKKVNTILVIIVIVVLLFASGGTFAVLNSKTTPQPTPMVQPSPSLTPDPTANPDSIGANWKTYTNVEDNYVVNYPESIAREKVYLNGEVKAFLSNIEKLPVPVGEILREIFISKVDNPNNLSAKDYVNQILNKKDVFGDALADKPEVLANIKRKAIIVGDEQGEQVEGLPAANSRIDIFVPHKNYIYVFVLDPSSTNGSNQDKVWQETFFTILSTFKFTP